MGVGSVLVDTRAGRVLQREPWGFASYRDGTGGVGEDFWVRAGISDRCRDPDGGSGHCVGVLPHNVLAFISLIKNKGLIVGNVLEDI